jgi:tyrosyl-tRNA synthetase
MFGKAMRIPDELLGEWWRLVAERDAPEGDPMASKLALAHWIVARSYGEEAAEAAEAHFTRVVRHGEAPEEVEEVALPAGDPVHLPALLVSALGVGSTSEARRLIAQGGVKLDGEPVADLDVPRADLDGKLLQAGKRRFARLAA